MSTPSEDPVIDPPEETPPEESPPEETPLEETPLEESPPEESPPEESKDISDMIQITNEMAFVGEVGTEVEEGEGETKDCLLPACPIDPSVLEGATQSIKGALDEHVVPKVDETTRSIRGALDEHVVPKMTETTQSIKGAFDEHVVPKVTETTQSIKGAFDEHVVPKVTETTVTIKGAFDEHVVPKVTGTTETIKGAFDEHIVPKVTGTTETIKGAIDEHVAPKFEMAKTHSMRTMETIATGSQKLLSDVQENSKKGVEEVQKNTQLFLENSKKGMEKGVEEVQKNTQVFLESSKRGMESVSAQAMAIVDEKVKPEFQKVAVASERAVIATTEGLQTNAPVYMGTAPGWTGLLPTVYWTLLSASLRAFGRVIFCDNPVTGIFIFLAILCASPLGAFCSILSVVTANATAMYLDMDATILATGQYARNAVLIGTGLVASLDFDFPETGNLESGVGILIFLSVVLAPATVLVELYWMKKVPSSIPSLLLPANIVLLVTIFCAKCWNAVMATQILIKVPVPLPDPESAHATFWLHESVFNGIAKIFFVEGAFAGFLILLGILFFSRILAASLFAGSLVSSFVLGYMVFQQDHLYLNSGYAGFNPALCAAGIFYYLVPSWKLTGLAFFGIVASVIAQGAVDVLLGILGMPVSTSLGFCFTLIPLLAIDLGEFFGVPDYFIRIVPETELSTPEEYIKSLDSDQPTDSSSEEGDDIEKGVADEETPLLE